MKIFYPVALFLFLTLSSICRAQNPPAGFTSTTVSSQWNEVVGLTFNAPGTHMFVWERPGKVWVVANTQRTLLLDISQEVGAWNDHGLLGFALHPQFESNGYIYLFYIVDRHHLMNFGTASYNPTTNDYFSATIGRLTRYTVTKSGGSYSVNPASRKILLGATKSTGVPSLARSHVTGGILFGADGTLLVATGDGASGSTPDVGSNAGTYYAQALADGILTPLENVGSFRAQLVDCLNGKILRLDPETGAGVPSNPFYAPTAPQTPRSKVWAMGFRNPFRLTLKPGTGTTDPASANPGTLYIGDVGFLDWEEIDVVSKPRQNMGWPLFEGLEANATFAAQKQYNLSTPNPQFNSNGCAQEYFYFQDLVKQATPTGTASFVNPCGGQAIPSSVPTFVHCRPLIDWKHGTGPSRTGSFSGGIASVVNIGAPGSPVSGPQFGGSADVGGVFYPHTDFPAEYRNTYFFGDYSGGWLRNMTVDDNNTPSVVRDFVMNGSIAVGMAVHPTEPGLYYANFPSEIRKITYQPVNHPPVAVATSDKKYGASPLSVQFAGSTSSDPDGQTLTYSWDFGDGTTSSLPNPSHIFQPATSAPTPYTVRLLVKDPLGLTSQASLLLSANNTPPQVTITSPTTNALYSITAETTFALKATVTDTEHSASQLSYQWQGFLHHAEHNHPEPIQTTPEASLTTAPEGCGTETYYYRVVLTVTDPAGLATTKEIRLNPDCSTAPAYSFYRAINLGGTALTLDGNTWEGATAPNYTTDGKASNKPTVPLLPATDAARSGMIRSFVYKLGGLTTTLSALPTGQYRVWAYVWEDNYPEVVSLALNGQPIVSNHNTGPAGTWSKLGPFEVAVATGTLQLTTSGGTVNLSGLEVWKASGTNTPTNKPPLANAGPDKTLTLPTNGTTLQGSGTDADGMVASYSWSQVSGPNTATFISKTVASPSVSGLLAGTYVFSLVVQDNNGASSSADQVTVAVSGGSTPPSTATLVALGTSWKYLDNGTNPGATWHNNFDDTGWKTGNAQFGYGDGDEATLVSFGPSTTVKYVTTYFRKTIQLANPAAFSAYSAQLRRDDGAIVYVNGQEVHRSNLAAGTVGYLTLASLAADDGQSLLSFSIPVSVWQSGSNVVAVEIHQATRNSSDLSFDLAITATSSGSAAARPLAIASKLSTPPAPTIFPNPSPTGQYVLEFPAELGPHLTYALFSSLGQLIREGALQVSKGSTRTNLDLSGVALPTGVYYLRLSGTRQQLQYKLLR